ncbi:phage adaptor protein [Phaeobacter inhibens]|uniref:phage adaptor protein n=1 Tax=Phaeobacter inhibens TaxID=221822 RepID=UPI000C9CCB9F|nr:hypothetical protein [Phaeobacter inhibens]AUQ64429.1 hypothetical protein PhaeoP51_03498 [Phaeobacter inhibens]
MITDYASLQTAISDTLDRADLPVTTFIRLAEAAIGRDLRHWRMESREEASVSTRFAALPTGWKETVRMSIEGGADLDLVSDAEMAAMRAASADTGSPCFYAFTAGQIELYPAPDGAYTLEHVFKAAVPALSDSNTENWLLDEAPDAYLYGALIHSAPHLVEDARLSTWGALYTSAIDGLQKESDKARHSGTGLKIKVR